MIPLDGLGGAAAPLPLDGGDGGPHRLAEAEKMLEALSPQPADGPAR